MLAKTLCDLERENFFEISPITVIEEILNFFEISPITVIEEILISFTHVPALIFTLKYSLRFQVPGMLEIAQCVGKGESG